MSWRRFCRIDVVEEAVYEGFTVAIFGWGAGVRGWGRGRELSGRDQEKARESQQDLTVSAGWVVAGDFGRVRR